MLAEREKDRAYLATKLGDLVVQLEKGDYARCARLAFQVWRRTQSSTTSGNGIEAEGVRCEARNDTSPGIPRVLTFEDPKGTIIEVFAKSTPIGKNTQVTGIGPLKLGHLAWVVSDPRPLAEFYGRVMGFRVSDWIEDWFCFMRCGPDHHTINFVRGAKTQMHHVAFELKDWAHVQSACDFLGSKKIPLIWGPGRHGPGHNVYTYHRNPDDQIIELFTELDKMLDESLGHFDPKLLASRPGRRSRRCGRCRPTSGARRRRFGIRPAAAVGVGREAAMTIRVLLVALSLVLSIDGRHRRKPGATRAIKLIVSTGPGLGTDIMARLMSDRLSRALGQQMFVENIPGAAGMIGASAAVRSQPDGYTFYFAPGSAISSNMFLYKSMPWRSDHRDLAPVAMVSDSNPFALSVQPDLPIKTLPELIAYSNGNPGKLSYGVDTSSGYRRRRCSARLLANER